jgi:hypothetical protein
MEGTTAMQLLHVADGALSAPRHRAPVADPDEQVR